MPLILYATLIIWSEIRNSCRGNASVRGHINGAHYLFSDDPGLRGSEREERTNLAAACASLPTFRGSALFTDPTEPVTLSGQWKLTLSEKKSPGSVRSCCCRLNRMCIAIRCYAIKRAAFPLTHHEYCSTGLCYNEAIPLQDRYDSISFLPQHHLLRILWRRKATRLSLVFSRTTYHSQWTSTMSSL